MILLKDALYAALVPPGLTYPEIQRLFPDYARVTIYEALSTLRAEGRARSEPIPRGPPGVKFVDRSRGPRRRWVRI